MSLLDALGIREGMAAVVGAGGKKTLMYHAADRLDRAVVTATVRIPIFDDAVEHLFVTDDPVGTLGKVDHWPVGVVPAREHDRYIGYDPAVLDDLRQDRGTDPILVKADGARMREFKAPGDDEPIIPETVDTVVAVASVAVAGQPLAESTVHRPERVADLTGRRIGESLTPTDIATVLASVRGGRKNVPTTATFVPVLNKVDAEADVAVAREIADRLLDGPAVDRVLLTSFSDRDEPLLDVVG